jgi:hypothetical protein
MGTLQRTMGALWQGPLAVHGSNAQIWVNAINTLNILKAINLVVSAINKWHIGLGK